MTKESVRLRKYDGGCFAFVFIISLSVVMCLIELVVGHLTHSIALVADSFHMFFDVLSLIIGLLSHQLSKNQNRTEMNAFGLSRASTVGGFINSTFMLSLCTILFRQSTERIVHLKPIENAKVVLFIAVIGLIINIIGFFVFHSVKHNNPFRKVYHSLPENHPVPLELFCEPKVDISDENLSFTTKKQISKLPDEISHDAHDHNLKGVLLHITGDALGSVFVIISTVAIIASKNPIMNILDPVTSFILASIMTVSTIPLFTNTARILLNLPPKSFEVYLFEKRINDCSDKHNVTFLGYSIFQTVANELICKSDDK
ncbi:Zinc/cadmium resistance protein [Thelohanellus kitauei]|uniref:Zinc/cadmium resistance protein n=1 Tax=Thelohanellus kitauei TaxID=669202 RepID=A0A0C2MBM8_THEKT|nr:Zinc/cadmium resistance protein [Thelohanellus kitauei]